MTIGVCWEFIEFGCDHLFDLDMQKDTVVHMISSVKLNHAAQKPVIIRHIHHVTVNGKDLGVDGYLDLGLIDTMKDLFVNFIGALVFSIIGYFTLRGDKASAEIYERFIIHRKTKETDFMNQAREIEELEEALARLEEKNEAEEDLHRTKKENKKRGGK